MRRAGFSLIELLLVIAIIVILAGLALPLSRRSVVSADLRLAVSAYEQCLYRAQELSRDVASDSIWGCHVESGLIRLFAGTTYAGRTTALDEDYEFLTSATVSGVSDRTFAKVSAAPQQSGTTTISNNMGQSKVIDVNTKGTVLY